MKKLLSLMFVLFLVGCENPLALGSVCEDDMANDVKHYGQPDDVTTARDDYSIYTTYDWYDRGLYITYYENYDSYRCERTVITTNN